MAIQASQLIGHRATTHELFKKYFDAGIRTFEADIVRVAGTNEFFFTHPLEVRGTKRLRFLDDGTVDADEGVNIVEQMRLSGFNVMTLADYAAALKMHPALTLICEAKVAQEGPGLVEYWPEVRRQLDSFGATDSRFVVASNSRREARAAWNASFPIGIFTGDDPDGEEMKTIRDLDIEYYFPDPYRIRRSLIGELQAPEVRISVAPYVLGNDPATLKALAEKMLGWDCSMVMCDRAYELID